MLFKYKIRCTTDNVDRYWWLPSSEKAPTTCPDHTDHSVDLSSVAIVDSNIPQPNPKTPDARDIIANNSIPPGYTVFPAGRGDNIANGTYGDGPKLKLSSTAPEVELQMLEHYYILGGTTIWEGATLDDEGDALLYAPATVGVNEPGEYIKVPYGGGNIYVPSDSGDWSLDLSATLNENVSILKCTPMPTPGNNGWFDYDSVTNTLTKNTAQKGGYNLFDFDFPIFKFGNCVFGKGGEVYLSSPNIVGKLLFNSWKIKFNLTTSTSARFGVMLMIAAKRNI